MDALHVIQSVEQIVSPVYLVGGSVRDMLLGTTPKDYDFCTPLPPETIEQRIRASGKRAYTVGKRFGTIGFKLDTLPVEITTFRQETYLSGSRHPEVAFISDLTADLARRDFTMNAVAMMAQNDHTTLIDPFGGERDIAAHLIRSVGNPVTRIQEDPLRMLRATRFAAQLGFTIDGALLQAVTDNASLIYSVSRERWMAELDSLLLAEHPEQGLEYLASTDLLRFILPEVWALTTPSRLVSVAWRDTLHAVTQAPATPEARWSALLRYIGTPASKGLDNEAQAGISAELATGIAYRLKWSSARRVSIVQQIDPLH